MWTYRQSTGELADAGGFIIASGYSGHALGLNNPAMQDVRDVGPIPQGLWSMGSPFDSPTHGPFAIALIPHLDTVTFGRDEFLMHGDEVDHIGDRLASRGCIIMPPEARREVWASGDHVLSVTP